MLDRVGPIDDPAPMSQHQDAITANAAFYAAISAGDNTAMARIWADDDTVSCIHPGWSALVGRAAVLESWAKIFAGPAPPQIQCLKPQALIVGGDARVLCVEIVGSAALAATNQFRLIDGRWRLVHHHASEIIGAAAKPVRSEHPRSLH